MGAAANPQTAASEPEPQRLRSVRNRILFLIVAWLIVLMPFLFWRGTWFGRPLSDRQISEYLRDRTHPRHTQHALVQIGERMSHNDPAVANWYPDLVMLASSPVQEIRNTDAWVMGQDPTRPEFHEALRSMLYDESLLVRGNAALALVRFGDAAGHDQIVSLLQPTVLRAPTAGRVTDTASIGAAVRQEGIVAQLQSGTQKIEIRTPITGRVRSMAVQRGEDVAAESEVAMLDPGSDQVWEALRALYVIGRAEDRPAVAPYLHPNISMPDRISQQAELTDRAIQDRVGR